MPDHEIDLPLLRGKPPLTHNQRLHYQEKARRTATIREAAGWATKALNLPPQKHITVQLHYTPGDMRRRDAPNLTGTSKPAIDGIVDSGLVVDDSDGYVTEIMPVIHPGPGKRRLWIEIHITEETAG